MKLFGLLLSVLLTASAGVGMASPVKGGALIGDTEKVYTLDRENTGIRGLAVDDLSSQAPRLLVLDQSRKIFAYQLDQKAGTASDQLKLLQVYDLTAAPGRSSIASPRGLAFSVEEGHGVYYFLNWHHSKGEITSQLWRFRANDGTSAFVDLSLYPFRIGDREVLDVAYANGKILVSFDASGYPDHDLRVQRGIIRLEWGQAYDGKLEFVRHMPDSGTSPSRGLTCMELEGAAYLWATVGKDHIYCADGVTGRGLFHFDWPRSTDSGDAGWGLAFGADALWVGENVGGRARVHRVNVTKNLNAFREGPRILRHLIMTIQTEPERPSEDPGKVYHYYSRPYAYDQLHNQGTWPETENVVDVSVVSNATIKSLTYDPAGDTSSRQHMSCVEYDAASSRDYASRYEIDIWTNTCRKFVYPHRVNKKSDALEGTDYLADDPALFNLSDTKTYDGFRRRVETHIQRKYGVAADMENPYWAARNALEYIQDHYYYPSRPKRKPAAVDYEKGHYDANPGSLKIALSARDYDKSQIIACSGTSVMLAGAMRYLGIPARWLGTGTERGPETWDTNGNGFLDEGETAPCTSGHRYTQVWLGNHYGWICFDSTPTRPDFNDYDPSPPIQSQWRYMNRAAAGHLKDKRIVFNVGSGLFRPLYRDFEYDEKLSVDNNCGGDQRYNLQGRFEKPEKWRLARGRIAVKNLCFIKDVTVSGPKDESSVTWALQGDWDKAPGAKVSIYLQRMAPDGNKATDLATLAKGIPCDAKAAVVDMSAYSGKRYRIIVRKEGDAETGGHSGTFDLE